MPLTTVEEPDVARRVLADLLGRGFVRRSSSMRYEPPPAWACFVEAYVLQIVQPSNSGRPAMRRELWVEPWVDLVLRTVTPEAANDRRPWPDRRTLEAILTKVPQLGPEGRAAFLGFCALGPCALGQVARVLDEVQDLREQADA